MSAEAVGWVFKHSPYTGATFVVHLTVADSVNDINGNEFWARQAELGKKARVGRQAVNTALSRLVANGFLVVLEDNSRTGHANRYRFEMPDVPGVWGGVRSGDTPLAKLAGGVSATTTQGVVHDDTEPKRTQGEEQKHVRTPPAPLQSDPEPSSLGSKTDYPPEFEAFWEAYPRKIEKKAAHRAWTATVNRYEKEKGRDRTTGAMLTAARHYAAACVDRDPSKIKHGATFVGPNEPWLDWIAGNPDDRHRAPRRTGFDSLPESLRM